MTVHVQPGAEPCESCSERAGQDISAEEAMEMFIECSDKLCTAYILRKSDGENELSQDE